jgi:hypothetical protein
VSWSEEDRILSDVMSHNTVQAISEQTWHMCNHDEVKIREHDGLGANDGRRVNNRLCIWEALHYGPSHLC